MHEVGTGDGILQATREHYGNRVFQMMSGYLSKQDFESSRNKMRTAPLTWLHLFQLPNGGGSRFLGRLQRVSDLRNWKGRTSRIKVGLVGYSSAVLTSQYSPLGATPRRCSGSHRHPQWTLNRCGSWPRHRNKQERYGCSFYACS